MSESLILFTIGPVQRFIETARKTEDLWMGSYILSYLNGIAMKTLTDTFSRKDIEIIFPATENQSLIKFFKGELENAEKETLKLATLPNRFLAKALNITIADLKTQLNTVETDVRTGFKNIAKKVFDKAFDENWKGTFAQKLFERQEEFFDFEPKVGIARDSKTITTKEGYLYHLNMIRLKQGTGNEDRFHFLVETQGIDFSSTQGILKLGGENKAFTYQISEGHGVFEFDDTEKQQLAEAIRNAEGKFKLYFATPTIWQEEETVATSGWRTNWMNIGDKTQRFVNERTGKSITCGLLTAAIGKYQNVGGWDIMAHRPKTMHRVVPAGAVYYLQLLSGEPEDIVELFHYQNLSDERAQEGFGLTFVGVV